MRVADRVTVSPALTVAGGCACPATNPSRIVTRCWPPSPTAVPPSPTTRPAPIAPRRWPASAPWALSSHEPPRGPGTNRRSSPSTAAACAACAPRRAPLDCGNSGSTMRMLAGVVAAHPFLSTLIGDASLSRRPMRRIIGPLTADGRRGHRRPRRSAAGDDSRRRSRRHPLHARDAQRPGEVRRAAGRTAGERGDRRSSSRPLLEIIRNGRWRRSAPRVARSHGRASITRLRGGQRLAGRDADGARATSRPPRSWRWPPRRCPGRT